MFHWYIVPLHLLSERPLDTQKWPGIQQKSSSNSNLWEWQVSRVSSERSTTVLVVTQLGRNTYIYIFMLLIFINYIIIIILLYYILKCHMHIKAWTGPIDFPVLSHPKRPALSRLPDHWSPHKATWKVAMGQNQTPRSVNDSPRKSVRRILSTNIPMSLFISKKKHIFKSFLSFFVTSHSQSFGSVPKLDGDRRVISFFPHRISQVERTYNGHHLLVSGRLEGKG